MIRDVPVEEIEPGDVVVLPGVEHRRVRVAEVRAYDDGGYVVVYMKRVSVTKEGRDGEPFRTHEVGPYGGLACKRKGETWPCERD